MSLSIDLLDSKKHNRSTFQCGDDSLDDYIKTRASQELKKRISTPFVLTDSPDRQVLGYYCISSYSIAMVEIDASTAKKLPRYPLLPAILIGRLAVDSRQQGKLYGKRLLLNALKRSFDSSKQVATIAVVVDAKNDNAVSFYRRYGFTEFQTDPLKLYILMESIEKLGL
jgi:ribosomal protein S18 acetylase RimI-like enzyme